VIGLRVDTKFGAGVVTQLHDSDGWGAESVWVLLDERPAGPPPVSLPARRRLLPLSEITAVPKGALARVA
jgi:hypothetical protein